jgi:hypothetical protein
MPVNSPMPNARSVVYCVAGSSRLANFTVPMLLEMRIASASRIHGKPSCGSSVIVRNGSFHFPPSPYTLSSGVTRSCSSSAAAAKILAVDPGSKVAVSAFDVELPSACRDVSARTSPVWGSTTTTSPPAAFSCSMASAKAVSTISCTLASSVRNTSWPGTGKAARRDGDSIVPPRPSRSTTAAPGRPASSESSSRSRPVAARPATAGRPRIGRAKSGSG